MAQSSNRRVSPEDYSKFLQQIELRNIILVSADIRRLGTPASGEQLEYEAKPTKRTYEATDFGFAATLNYLVRLRAAGESNPIGEVRVAITAAYSSQDPMTGDLFDVFGELNLPLNVYPYVREFVHSATTRMGFPGLILPTVKRT